MKFHTQPDKIDRKNWINGPWLDEPDSELFIYKDYKCIIFRILNNGYISGHLCGYLFIPQEDFKKIDIESLDVHGGITFSQYDDETNMQCLGFDCAHIGTDIIPAYEKFELENISENFIGKVKLRTYKDFNFVKKSLKNLVDQIIEQLN